MISFNDASNIFISYVMNHQVTMMLVRKRATQVFKLIEVGGGIIRTMNVLV